MTAPETVETQTQQDTNLQLSPEQAEVFADLYMTRSVELCAYANKLTRNQDEAEDLVQEAFTRAMKTYGTREGREEELPLILFRIVKNAFLDRTSKARRAPIQSHDFAEDTPQNGYYNLNGFCGVVPKPGPEEVVVEREHSKALFEKWVEVIGTNPKSRAMVRRSIASLFLDGAGYIDGEIADILGAPISTIRTGNRRTKSHVQSLEQKQLVSV